MATNTYKKTKLPEWTNTSFSNERIQNLYVKIRESKTHITNTTHNYNKVIQKIVNEILESMQSNAEIVNPTGDYKLDIKYKDVNYNQINASLELTAMPPIYYLDFAYSSKDSTINDKVFDIIRTTINRHAHKFVNSDFAQPLCYFFEKCGSQPKSGCKIHRLMSTPPTKITTDPHKIELNFKIGNLYKLLSQKSIDFNAEINQSASQFITDNITRNGAAEYIRQNINANSSDIDKSLYVVQTDDVLTALNKAGVTNQHSKDDIYKFIENTYKLPPWGTVAQPDNLKILYFMFTFLSTQTFFAEMSDLFSNIYSYYCYKLTNNIQNQVQFNELITKNPLQIITTKPANNTANNATKTTIKKGRQLTSKFVIHGLPTQNKAQTISKKQQRIIYDPVNNLIILQTNNEIGSNQTKISSNNTRSLTSQKCILELKVIYELDTDTAYINATIHTEGSGYIIDTDRLLFDSPKIIFIDTV